MEFINKIELQGSVGCVRTNHVQGMTVQNFSLYTEHLNRLKDGSIIREGTWHNVVAWEKTQVGEGDVVKVIGRLRQQIYTSANGAERIYYEAIASKIDIVQ